VAKRKPPDKTAVRFWPDRRAVGTARAADPRRPGRWEAPEGYVMRTGGCHPLFPAGRVRV